MKKLFVSTRHIFLMIGGLSVACFSYGQQEGQYSQYIASGLGYNPAFAGNTGVLSMTAIHREQWMGFSGRPRSTMFSAHTPLQYEALGVGLTIDNHAIGPIRDLYAAANVSYSIQLDRTSKFSFGLKAGVDLLSFDRESLATSSGTPHNSKHDRSKVNPNIGAGVLWQGERFLFGVGVPRLLRSKYYKNIIDTRNLQQHHYYVTASYIIDLNSEWQIRPSTHIKVTKGSPLSVDISATAVYEERLWIGGFYRVDAALGLLLQVQANDAFKIGLASGFSTHKINKTSLEVMLSYEIDALHVGRKISPRKF